MKIFIKGVVQGVGFRPTVSRVARGLGLHGYVRNRGSYVEIFIEEGERVNEFLTLLKKSLPPIAKITSIELSDAPPDEEYDGFEIKKSRDDERTSIVPPDTAICEDCLRELFDPSNRRYLYPFTNCTKCGARFSLVEDLPYDRERTTMRLFPMCEDCLGEYLDPANRRYDAQTISCRICGPKMYLINRKGERMYVENPIREFAKAIDSGAIGVIKGWGGYHVVCKLSEVPRLRRLYNRPTKPFAVMFRDLKSIEKYAYVNDKERELLLSPIRPIVLLRKRIINEETENIAPGLPYIGVYLPYSAIQHILFYYLRSNAIIMTSGNLPGRPMAITDEEAIKLPADIYLSHERPIANRVDDSVVKVYKNRTFIIRRSRGYVPLPFPVDHDYKILSVGAEMNITFTISKDRYMFTSQHIGDGIDYEVIEFLITAVEKFKKILRIEDFDLVVADKHPKYSTREFAERYYENVILVQHHHAHAATLLYEHNTESGVFLSFDGTGFGDDGTIWGGELLYATRTKYVRIASLKPVKLIGGEKAIWNPHLSYLSFLRAIDDVRLEDTVPEHMLKVAPWTSSMGRFLDALSYALGLCRRATYDGEPAMRLESLLLTGEGKPFEVDVEVKDGIRHVNPYPYLQDIKKLRTKKDKADFVYRLIYGTMEAFMDIVDDYSSKLGTRYVGFTGGVSYNIPMTEMFESLAGERGLIPLLHDITPNGDAGISIGQNYIASGLILSGEVDVPSSSRKNY